MFLIKNTAILYMQMSPDPTGEMYAWIAMAAVSALASAVGVFTIHRRR
ncbi:hypothetical protein NSIN_20650 [Nitrosotalea sinensis]|uniref:Uncharacterized protein n=1 Tax=Nitrosotalea sinensis TaxID=1499975 RepID=A0A2H1EGY4_9ARCH|nr:hypothetical protein NSIN_20650 [Candidatus Nitrosotalea sinensis]